MRVEFKVYSRFTEKSGWLVETFDTFEAAKEYADDQSGDAWVRKVESETVYRNGKGKA